MSDELERHNCPACLFGPWLLPFGQHKGNALIDTPESYQRWICANKELGLAFVWRQEMWHKLGHPKELDPHASIEVSV